MAGKKRDTRAERRARAAALRDEGRAEARQEAAALDAALEDPDAARKYFYDQLNNQLESYHAKCRKTGNPIYVFQAIQLCRQQAYHAEILLNEPPRPTTLLPDWVLEYLVAATKEALRLAHGQDTLDPDDALRRLPQALFLSRKGWNAFAAFAADSRKEAIADKVADLREHEGMSLEDAARQVSEEEGLSHSRSVLRIVQQAKALWKRDET